MQAYRIKTWHPATWLLFLIWVSWSVWANFPTAPGGAAAYQNMAEDYTRLTGRSVPAKYVMFFHDSGFPLTYRRYELFANGTHRLDFFSVAKVILDVLLCALATASVVYLVQRVRKFSLRTLFVMTAVCGVLLSMRWWVGMAAVMIQSWGWKSLAHVPGYLAFCYLQLHFLLPCILAVVVGFGWLFHRIRGWSSGFSSR